MLLIFRPVVVVSSVSSLVGINIVKDWPSFWQRPRFVTFRLWMKHPNSRNLVSQVKRLKKPCLSPWFTYASPYHRSYSDSLEKMLKYSTVFLVLLVLHIFIEPKVVKKVSIWTYLLINCLGIGRKFWPNENKFVLFQKYESNFYIQKCVLLGICSSVVLLLKYICSTWFFHSIYHFRKNPLEQVLQGHFWGCTESIYHIWNDLFDQLGL